MVKPGSNLVFWFHISLESVLADKMQYILSLEIAGYFPSDSILR